MFTEIRSTGGRPDNESRVAQRRRPVVVRASQDYRHRMVEVVTRRVLQEVLRAPRE